MPVANIELLAACALEELKTWLYDIFSGHTFSPLTFTAEPDTVVQIQHLFDHSSIRDQEKLKAALVLGISEWRQKAHGYKLLVELLSLAGLVRATGIVVPLFHLFQTGRLAPNGSDPSFTACRAAVGVLAGFPPRDDIRILFERLYFDDRTDLRLGGQLFNGLCGCLPDDYPRFLRRYLAIRNQLPGYFSDRFVFGFFVQRVPACTIGRHLDKLRSEERQFLLTIVSSLQASSLKLVIDQGGASLILDQREVLEVPNMRPTEPTSTPLLFDIYRVKEKTVRDAGGTLGWIRAKVRMMGEEPTH